MATSTTEGVSLQVTVHISPENVPKFFEAFKPLYETVIAEPDCTFFELYQDPEDPGTISWVENWYILCHVACAKSVADSSLGQNQLNGYYRYGYEELSRDPKPEADINSGIRFR